MVRCKYDANEDNIVIEEPFSKAFAYHLEGLTLKMMVSILKELI